MNIMKRLILLLLLSLIVPTAAIFAQDPKPEATPPVVAVVAVPEKNANADPLYKELRSSIGNLSSLSGDYATVNNLVLKKDCGIFTLKSGEVYFTAPVKGRTVGAVFIGEGEFSLTPPNETEKKSIAMFIDAPEVKEQFTQLVMIFSDKTFDEIKNSPNAKMATGGGSATKAKDAFKDKELLLRKTFRFNISSRILADFYTPERAGFFTAFIDGKNYGKLAFTLDPLGIPEVYPEQVALVSYAETTGGIWTAFHLQNEYDKGTANSWTDRRLYDITKHDLDVTIQGTRVIVKDVMTLQMQVPNVRVLPFDLFPTMRVKSVRSEDNAEMDYVQEDKNEDADFAAILPKPVEVGKPFKLIVEYDGLDALLLAGKGNYILNPGARSNWYPNNPSADFGDRAIFDMTFRYPKRSILVGVGDRVGEDQIDGDNKISKWSTKGIAIALAGFNYGDFKITEIKDENAGYNIEVYTNKDLPAELREAQVNSDVGGFLSGDESTGGGGTTGSMNTGGGAKMVMTETQNAVRIYNNFFGKISYSRLAISQQPDTSFGQAWPTLVYLPYGAFMSSTHRAELFGARGGTDGFWREVTPHEVAHQWWGHMVGWTSYHDQWMSEGFAQFSAAVYIQYVRKDIKYFNDFWEEQRKQIVEPSPATKNKKPYTIGPVTQGYRLNTAKTGAVAQFLIYPKGAYILQMLRMMMFDHKGGTGDEKFRAMMTDFVQSHYNQEVSTEDLKKITEKHITPEMDVTHDGKMDWFFNEWVYGTEIPDFKLSYEMSTNSTGKPVFNGKLTQSGVSDGFASVVPLYMDFGAGWKYVGRITMMGNKTLDINNVTLPAVPKKVAIDAYHDILNTRIEVVGK
jgi:hypothetical protein